MKQRSYQMAINVQSIHHSVQTITGAMIGNRIAVIEQRAPIDETGKQWVASDKTHCKPFDLPIPEQWVFGQAL